MSESRLSNSAAARQAVRDIAQAPCISVVRENNETFYATYSCAVRRHERSPKNMIFNRGPALADLIHRSAYAFRLRLRAGSARAVTMIEQMAAGVLRVAIVQKIAACLKGTASVHCHVSGYLLRPLLARVDSETGNPPRLFGR